MDKQYSNILVIKMSSLGDVMHALPSLHALRSLYPAAKISWLVEPQFAGLLPGKPYIDEKIVFYKNDLKKKNLLEKFAYLKKLRTELHSRHFDLVIDLQGLLKSSLVALLSGCSNRIGYCEMREGSFLVTRAICGPNSKNHVVERYLDVIRYLGAKVDKAVFPLPDFAQQEARIKDILHQQGVTGKYAVFFPGSRWVTKEWPLERYAELAKKFVKEGVSVVIAGGPADREKGIKIKAGADCPQVVNLVGQTDMLDIAALVKNSCVCVGGDTGPLHVAAAAGAPTVTMFGPISSDRTRPYGELNTSIITTAPCSPCFKRTCPKTFICMDTISVDEVFSACLPHLATENA